MAPGCSADVYCFSESEGEEGPSPSPSGFAASIDGGLDEEFASGSAPSRVLRVRLSGGTVWGPALRVDKYGDTYFFLQPHGDAHSLCRPLLCANVRMSGCSIFISLSDVSATPPYRIENHCPSSFTFLQPSEKGTEQVELKPMSWANFVPLPEAGFSRDDVPVLSVRGEGREQSWRELSLGEVRKPRRVVIGGERVHVVVELSGRTRVLLLSLSLQRQPPPVPILIPSGLQLLLTLERAGLALIHEDSTSGRPQARAAEASLA